MFRMIKLPLSTGWVYVNRQHIVAMHPLTEHKCKLMVVDGSMLVIHANAGKIYLRMLVDGPDEVEREEDTDATASP